MFRFILVIVLLTLSLVPLGINSPDDAMAQIGGCPAIEFGQTQTGTIDNANPRITYCVLAEAGDVLNITLTATSGDLDTYLILEMGDGTSASSVAENDDISEGNINSAIQYTAPSTAVFFIVATRYEFEGGFSSGGYSLTLNATGNSGNTGGNDTSAGDMDGDGYDDNVDGCPDTFGGEPDGCPRPDSDGDGYNDNIDLCPFEVGGEPDGCPTDGSGQPNSSNPSQNCAESDGLGYDVTEIISDQTVSGYIDSPMIIVYCFYGEEGNVPYMQMNAVEGTGDLDPYMSLLDASGNMLMENDNIPDCATCTNAAISYVLPSNGIYYIQLQANNSVGNYTLDFQLTNEFTRACDGYIAQDYTVYGTIDNQKTSYRYCFNGKVGDTIQVWMTATFGNLNSYLSLSENSDPQGFIIAENDNASADTGDAYFEFVLPSTGVFNLWATRDEGLYGQTDQTTNRTSGDFNIFFLLEPASDNINNDDKNNDNTGNPDGNTGTTGDGATAIQNAGCPELYSGSSISETISSSVPETLYCFYGYAGDAIEISTTATSGGLDTYLVVWDVNGDLIAENDDDGDRTDSRVSFTVNENGLLYVLVTSYEFSQDASNTSANGTFDLLFVQSTNNAGNGGGKTNNDDTGNNGNAGGGNTGTSGGNTAATAIQNEGCVEILSGTPINETISNSEPVSYYCFYGYAGETVQVELIATSGDLDPYLTLMSGEGEILVENDDNGETFNSALSFTVGADGIFYIEATSYGYLFEGPTYGNFQLSFSR